MGELFTISIYRPTIEKEDIYEGLPCQLHGVVDGKIINIKAEIMYIQEPVYERDEIYEGIIMEEIAACSNFFKITYEVCPKIVKKLQNRAMKIVADIRDHEHYEFIKMTLSCYRIDFKLIYCKVVSHV